MKVRTTMTSEGFVQAHLYMIRGDTESITVKQEKDGEEIPFETGDTVTLTVKKLADQPTLIEKKITSFEDGKAIIQFLPEDTKELKFGIYKYDIQKSNGYDVKTIIYYSDFIIKEEVSL